MAEMSITRRAKITKSRSSELCVFVGGWVSGGKNELLIKMQPEPSNIRHQDTNE